MIRNWLLLASASYGVGFGSTLLITRNLSQSAQSGLASIPAVIVSINVLSRQRKKEIERQVIKERLSLDQLIQAEGTLQQQLQLKTRSYEEILDRVKLLESNLVHHSKAILHSQRQKEFLQKEVSELLIQQQQQEKLLSALEVKLNEKYNIKSKLLAEISDRYRQLKNANTEFDLVESKRNLSAAAIVQLENNLQGIRSEIEQCTFEKQQYSEAMLQSQSQQKCLQIEVSALVMRRHQKEELLNELELNLSEKHSIKSNLLTEINDQQRRLRTTITEFDLFESKRNFAVTAVKQLEINLQNLQAEIDQYTITKQELERTIPDLSEPGAIMFPEFEAQSIKSSESEQRILQIEDSIEADSIVLEEQPCLQEFECSNVAKEITDNDLLKDPIEFEFRRSARSLYGTNELVDLGQNFMNYKYAKKVWEEKILPFWLDKDKPAGQRFLGHVNISRDQSDELIDLVGENLRLLKPITERNAYKKFNSLGQDWIKIFTFALSEYACYYSDDKFWEGICDRWKLPSSQIIENTLRKITKDGIRILGLVETKDGYKYVSTMWLQSGIPYKNLEQFAQLLKELADESTWSSLSQDSAENLSTQVLQLYERKSPQGGTLGHLLNHQKPTAGRIINGIAKIADKLEEQQLDSSILEDNAKRSEIVSNLSLNNEFFLRDWNAVIKILNHKSIKTRYQNSPKDTGRINLHLDIEGSGNIQLFLAEQNIWDDQWEILRETECTIPKGKWKGCFGRVGGLNIPELISNITSPSQDYYIELHNYHNDSIHTWSCTGIDEELPCLIFDAISGENLLIELDNLVVDSTEIICFFPKEMKMVLDESVRLLDDNTPSSIKGWKGYRVHLIDNKSMLSFDSFSRQIIWQLKQDDTPRLVGLKSNLSRSEYLEAPALWLPPNQQFANIIVKVKDLERNLEIFSDTQSLLASEKWVDVSIGDSLSLPGHYRVNLCSDQLSWQQELVVKTRYDVTDRADVFPLKICIDRQELKTTELPLECAAPYEFDAKSIEITGLWNLELIDLILVNDENDRTHRSFQADPHGNLEIRLSELREFWNRSAKKHLLGYCRRGEDFSPLLTMILSDSDYCNN
jgi:hypothetical protein